MPKIHHVIKTRTQSHRVDRAIELELERSRAELRSGAHRPGHVRVHAVTVRYTAGTAAAGRRRAGTVTSTRAGTR